MSVGSGDLNNTTTILARAAPAGADSEICVSPIERPCVARLAAAADGQPHGARLIGGPVFAAKRADGRRVLLRFERSGYVLGEVVEHGHGCSFRNRAA